ncbi:MAG: hypothetical protein AB1349_06495 [Elusimicrobiota bacterium]
MEQEQESVGQVEQGQTTEPKKLMPVGELLSKVLKSAIKLFPKTIAIWVICGICVLLSIGLGIGLVFLLKGSLGVTVSIIISACSFGLFTVYLGLWLGTSVIVLVGKIDSVVKIKEILKTGWEFTMPYLVIACWSGLIIPGGFVCLIVPGIIFFIWFWVVPFVLVNENIRGRLALIRSKNLVKGYGWAILGRFLVLLLILGLVSVLLALFEKAIPKLNILWLSLNILFNIFWQVLVLTFIYLIHKDLYNIKGPAVAEELVGFPKNWTGWLFSVLGIIAIIAYFWCISAMMFKYSGLIKKSQEGAAKGYTGALRSAITIYYGDNEGKYSETLDELVPKYIEQIWHRYKK